MLLMGDWNEVDISGWKPQIAKELMGLFVSLFKDHAKFGGARTTSIDIGLAAQRTYEVFITQEGFGDDSVSGVRWAVKVKQNDYGWYIEKMWRQQRCYRGPRAGTWTKRKCL